MNTLTSPRELPGFPEHHVGDPWCRQFIYSDKTDILLRVCRPTTTVYSRKKKYFRAVVDGALTASYHHEEPLSPITGFYREPTVSVWTLRLQANPGTFSVCVCVCVSAVRVESSTVVCLLMQVRGEAEGQKWASDRSAGEEEGRVWAADLHSAQTGGWLLWPAEGSQVQVQTRHLPAPAWCTFLSVRMWGVGEAGVRITTGHWSVFTCVVRTDVFLSDWQRGLWGGLQPAPVTLRGQDAAEHSSALGPSRCLNTAVNTAHNPVTLRHSHMQ